MLRTRKGKYLGQWENDIMVERLDPDYKKHVEKKMQAEAQERRVMDLQ